jgi:hypothetical protein
MKIEADLRDPVNRIDGVACVLLHDLTPSDMSAPACAYPGGAVDVYADAYQVDHHHLAWSLPGDGGVIVDVHVHWEGVWVANVDEIYGCIDNATASVAVADTTRAARLTVEATFGTPVFTAVTAAGDGDWIAWGATLPVTFRVCDADTAETGHGWLLDANGQSYSA